MNRFLFFFVLLPTLLLAQDSASFQGVGSDESRIINSTQKKAYIDSLTFKKYFERPSKNRRFGLYREYRVYKISSALVLLEKNIQINSFERSLKQIKPR
jgi:hypothetical protein